MNKQEAWAKLGWLPPATDEDRGVSVTVRYSQLTELRDEAKRRWAEIIVPVVFAFAFGFALAWYLLG